MDFKRRRIGRLGQTLGQYRIIEQLGKGGMATVFKAYQPSLERYVAVKVLPPYFVHEPGFSERFRREAKAVAKLQHPHILPIYDSGQDGDISYIAMRYVDTGTLKDLESGDPLPLEQAAQNKDSAHANQINQAHSSSRANHVGPSPICDGIHKANITQSHSFSNLLLVSNLCAADASLRSSSCSAE